MVNNLIFYITLIVLVAALTSIFVFRNKKNYKNVARILKEFLSYAEKEQLQGLIVLERNDNLDRFVATGHKLELKLKSLALAQLFGKNNEENSGAVVIKNNTIVADNAVIAGSGPHYLNLRHRIAAAITDQTDALAIVFENGQTWIYIQGVKTLISPERLVALLTFSGNKKKIRIN